MKARNFIDMTGWVMSEHGVPESRLTVIEQAETYMVIIILGILQIPIKNFMLMRKILIKLKSIPGGKVKMKQLAD